MTDNEQLIRQGYDAWNQGDWARMEALLAPDFEVDATDRVLNPDHYVGIEGFRRLAGEMAEVWDSWEIEPVEFIVLRGVKPRAAERLALGELAPSEDDDTTVYIMRMEVDPK